MPHDYAQTEKVQQFIQEFAGRYMLQVMKQNKDLQALARDQQHEINVLKQRLAMMAEVVGVQHQSNSSRDNRSLIRRQPTAKAILTANDQITKGKEEE